VSDDWTPDDAYLDSDDPEAQAREQRRQEREARRRERQSKQHPGEPPSPGASAAEGAAAGGAEGVPPPQRRLPSSPAREPFAQRITAMRKRLAESRPRRLSPRAATAARGPGARRGPDQGCGRQLAPHRPRDRRRPGAVVPSGPVPAVSRLPGRPGRGHDPEGVERSARSAICSTTAGSSPAAPSFSSA